MRTIKLGGFYIKMTVHDMSKALGISERYVQMLAKKYNIGNTLNTKNKVLLRYFTNDDINIFMEVLNKWK